MTDILQRSFAISGDIIENMVGDEVVMLHLGQAAYFGLDATGARIWELLKEGMLPASIVERLAREYAADPERIADDVRQFLTDLEAQGMILDG